MQNKFCDPAARSTELGLVPCEHRKRFPKDEQGICTEISVSHSQTGLEQLHEVFCQGNRCRNHAVNEVCPLKAGEQEAGHGLQLDVKEQIKSSQLWVVVNKLIQWFQSTS